MNPLLLLAGNLLPTILDFVGGERASDVSKAVTAAVTAATGTTDPVAAEQQLQNPTAAAQLRVELARIVSEEKKIAFEAEAQRRRDEIEAEAKERKDALERDLANHKVRLDEIATTVKAAHDQREQDMRETRGARQMLSELVDKDRYIARTPMVISYLVTIGFFVVLGLFVFMKPALETSQPAKLPQEALAVLNTLRPDQIAALVQPRSDFVIQIINISVGALAAAFATVMSFWLGSSQSSRTKDAIAANLQERNVESQERQAKESIKAVETAVKTAAQSAATTMVVDESGALTGIVKTVPAGSVLVNPAAGAATADPAPEPVKPAAAGLLAEILPKLTQNHRHFPNSVSWALTPAGISIDGARRGNCGQAEDRHADLGRFRRALCGLGEEIRCARRADRRDDRHRKQWQARCSPPRAPDRR